VEHVITVELYTATRALDLRRKDVPTAKIGCGTEEMYLRIRSVVPYQAGDAWWGPEIHKVKNLIFG
jgi:histidine ammonia-lyase